MRAPSIGVELQEELEVSEPAGLFRRGRNRIGHQLGPVCPSKKGSLAGRVGEGLIAERQPDDPGGRCCADGADDLQDARGQNSLMLQGILRLARECLRLAQGPDASPRDA